MRIIVVGAGAAGLMAAGSATADSIIVLERNEKAGKKLYITGKGRCNVTHDCLPSEFLNGVISNPKFLLSAINKFTPQATVSLIESMGVPTKLERGGRIFPLSDKASDVTKALLKYAEGSGTQFEYNTNVIAIKKSEDEFIVKTDRGDYICDKLILACGGASYPLTGSNGDGYTLAKMLGEQIVKPVAALVPIDLCEDIASLSGVSLKNVRVSVTDNFGKQVANDFGEMLFTHTGVSGPIILSISSLINRANLSGYKLKIDLKPALDEQTLDKRLLSDFEKFAFKQLKNSMGDLAPKSLIPYIIKESQIDETIFVNNLTRVQRYALIKALKELTFSIKKIGDIDIGIVTAGGVDVKNISPKTMQSKTVSGLYFCGEMLDVDAVTGGYNIQIALSTGYVAGVSVGLATGEVK